MNKTYYKSQTPVETITFTVKDERSIVRNLTAYTGATVLIAGPDGVLRTGGTATITNAANGVVTFTFPNTTMFDVVGDYAVQLKLTNGTKADYADITTIRVVESLEG